MSVPAPTKKASTARAVPANASAADHIARRIADLADWRGAMLAHVRALILATDPSITEDWKWRGVPVWSRDGMICTGESYKSAIKLTFPKGATVADPAKLFNASLDGNVRRAIDIHEGDTLDVGAFQSLIRAAIAVNGSGRKKR